MMTCRLASVLLLIYDRTYELTQLTLCCNLLDLDPELVGHEPEDTEDNEPSKEACQAVTEGNHQGIPGYTKLVYRGL